MSWACIQMVLSYLSDISDDFLYLTLPTLLCFSQGCSQNLVNISVGSWIFFTLLLSLVLATIKTPDTARSEYPKDLLLFEDQYSPVGYRVPTFPAFIINPSHAKKGLPLIQFDHELYFSVFVALLMMGAIVSMAFTGWHKNLEAHLTNLISTI